MKVYVSLIKLEGTSFQEKIEKKPLKTYSLKKKFCKYKDKTYIYIFKFYTHVSI